MFLRYFAIIFILILIFPENTYAYLDPGNGSYLIQLTLGFLFGGLLSIKLFWKNIKSYFKTKKDDQENTP